MTTFDGIIEGVIEPEKLYSLPVLHRITGLGDVALRRAQKRGLRVLRAGRYGWVRGCDFILWAAGGQ